MLSLRVMHSGWYRALRAQGAVDSEPVMEQAASEIELLLVGGGHAHVQVLRALAMKPLLGVRVTVVSREIHTPYSGMLPGHLAGFYSHDDIHIDLGPLANRAGARLIHDEITGLDAASRRVHFDRRPSLRYDVLSLDTGSTPALDALEGDGERIVPVKPISAFLPRFEALLERIAASSDALDVAVVGGGAGGAELVLSVAERLRKEGQLERVRLHLVCAGHGPLEHAGPAVRRRFEQALADSGIEVHRGQRIVRADRCSLLTAQGAAIAADEVLWVTQAAAPQWPQAAGLAVDDAGFIEVGPTLQSRSHPEVFAAGDLAALVDAPRPKSGVYAVRAGPVLARNLRAFIRDEALEAWQPQARALYLVTTGTRDAVVVHERIPAFAGRWVWRWKDWIDRRFMARFTRLPVMPNAQRPSEVGRRRGGGRLDSGMRCVGCGSKLSTATLLAGLGQERDGVAAFEDAATLNVGQTPVQQTLDGFPFPVADPWLAGRIATIHALGDVLAMGAQPAGALAFAVVPYMARQIMAEDLAQLMTGVREALAEHDCELLGGHSCEGAEGMIALSVSGVPEEDAPLLGKGGGRAGDALVLTKALGTGAVLAATADGRLPSRDRSAAVEHMLVSNAAAVPVLREHGARGCTDVTGFGLLGHALEMAQASACGLELVRGAAVALPGAQQALAAGHVSSLQVQNEEAFAAFEIDARAIDEAEVRLLADPQTCGGLLAAVPARQVDACVRALRARGFPDACRVGALRSVAQGYALVSQSE